MGTVCLKKAGSSIKRGSFPQKYLMRPSRKNMSPYVKIRVYTIDLFRTGEIIILSTTMPTTAMIIGATSNATKKLRPRGYKGVSGIGAKRIEGTVGEVHHAAQPIDDVQADGNDQETHRPKQGC